MCGIVGLYIKNPDLKQQLSALLAAMLIEMSDRGPGSAGVAIYRNPVAAGHAKLTLRADAGAFDWPSFKQAARQAIGADCDVDHRFYW